MARRIIFGDELRKTAKTAMNTIHRAVSSSLGPSGKLSLLQRPGMVDLITKDGVTIAHNCRPLEDEAQDLVAAKILEIAIKTNTQSGDGTTTSIVLANALFEEALKHVNKVDAAIIKREIEAALPSIMAQLDAEATPVDSIEDMENIAIISANGDVQAGKIIAKAIDTVGQDGFVTLTEGDSHEATLTITEGFQIDKGANGDRYLKSQAQKTFKNPAIFVFDGLIQDPNTLNYIYHSVAPRPFVVIAALSEMCQKFMVGNVTEGNMEGVHITPPGFKGDQKTQALLDIATVCGATLFNEFTFKEGNPDQEPIDASHLGSCEEFSFTKHNSDMIRGNGSKEAIIARIEDLKSQMAGTKSLYEQSGLRHRVGKMTSGVAVIGVGGTTEDETLERKDRFEDAINATRSAIEQGIVAGGGYTLFKIGQKMKATNTGEAILKKALEAPLRTIVKNTGVDVESVVDSIRQGNEGYNARTHTYCDLKKEGVVDPVKSTKTGLRNAVSIVDLLINLEVLSVNVINKDNVKEMMSVMKSLQSGDS